MMRVLVVAGALLLGLVGLLMSLCGGGVAIVTLSGPAREVGLLSFAIPCLLIGSLFVWLSVVILRRKPRQGWSREP